MVILTQSLNESSNSQTELDSDFQTPLHLISVTISIQRSLVQVLCFANDSSW